MRFQIYRRKPGFTLMELVMATVIFAMMMSSLVTIYSTIHRHMFQKYRENILKSDLAMAMKAIQSRLMMATRVDTPNFGGSSNVLAFTSNVDAQSGCSPINSAVANVWHYICTSACPSPYTGETCLYYHMGTVSRNTGGCPCSATDPDRWTGSYPVPNCGRSSGGDTVTLLARFIRPPKSPPYPSRYFNRTSAWGVREVDQVRVTLRARKVFMSGREVDVTLDTIIHTQTTPP